MRRLIVLILIAVFLIACGGAPQQQRAAEAQAVAAVPDKSNFNERQQIAKAEAYLDLPGRIYWVHLLTDEGKLIATVTCEGRPNSSTESLEPNEVYARTYSQYSDNGYSVALDGGQVGYSPEAMGLDGSYGEPVAYRYCMTTTGHYFDFGTQWRYIVTDEPLVFPAPEVRENAELAAKKLIAEQALRDGKCVDMNLNIISCEGK